MTRNTVGAVLDAPQTIHTPEGAYTFVRTYRVTGDPSPAGMLRVVTIGVSDERALFLVGLPGWLDPAEVTR